MGPITSPQKYIVSSTPIARPTTSGPPSSTAFSRAGMAGTVTQDPNTPHNTNVAPESTGLGLLMKPYVNPAMRRPTAIRTSGRVLSLMCPQPMLQMAYAVAMAACSMLIASTDRPISAQYTGNTGAGTVKATASNNTAIVGKL
eukprot:CAMPEP_0174366618 /NCGR_PEP_ID=MMETSP0811_2-20130205/81930_1 /TAXON_ID=73025 ORGANISM="Eutreptiella gymnastica-like, Strain CCMP1594" /NCGR_SAMPLE_ID=MMETSP0811_2 /ASSEMBLY_ACC=CAM_ASM_000667 /LENGTH=142 /DNA_ID=CAMNT_0015508359 /DNA_START=180 /DNA_END=608 /DNA_ORIENTATION=+